MYHIKSDRRSQASAAEIARGLQECLRTTPLKNVTVSDIHRVTGISRATFYRLFDTPEDVLIYQLDQMTDGILEGNYRADLTPRQIMEQTIALGLQKHEFLQALVENGRQDLLFRYTEKSMHNLDGIRRIFPENMEPVEREFIIAHLSMSMVAIQTIWARNGQKETPHQLLQYLNTYARMMQEMTREK